MKTVFRKKQPSLLQAQFLKKATFLGLSFLLLPLRAQAQVKLQQKLEAQFGRYAQARAYLIDASERRDVVEKERLERLIAPAYREYEITQEDRATLEKEIREAIAVSKEKANADSFLDLRKLKMQKAEVIKDFFKTLPKGGMLHTHVSGTADLKTVTALMEKYNPTIDHKTLESILVPTWLKQKELAFLSGQNATRYLELPEGLRRELDLLHILPEGPQDFSRFIALFILRSSTFKNDKNLLELIEITIDHFLERAKANGISYVEFTSEPGDDFPITQENLPRLEELVKEWKQRYDIDVRFNYSFLRIFAPEENLRRVEEMVQISRSFAVTGIDYLGDETQHSALEGQGIYTRVHRANRERSAEVPLKMTMHAGELGDPSNPRDALILGVDGIGHGVLLRKDPVALRYAMERKTRIETSVLSNLRLRVVSSVAEHPVLDFLRLGLPVSMTTDDEGMFGIVLSDEFENLFRNTDISWNEMKQLVRNSISSSFLDEKTKHILLSKVEEQLRSFENDWAAKLGRDNSF